MTWLSWLIGALVVSTLGGWMLYWLGLSRMPKASRPKIEHWNRFGEPVGEFEAPDFHIMPGISPDE